MSQLLRELVHLVRLYMIQRKMRSSLPTVFALIDRELKTSSSPLDVTHIIKDALEYSTGQAATTNQVLAVIQLYSPIKAACRSLER